MNYRHMPRLGSMKFVRAEFHTRFIRFKISAVAAFLQYLVFNSHEYVRRDARYFRLAHFTRG